MQDVINTSCSALAGSFIPYITFMETESLPLLLGDAGPYFLQVSGPPGRKVIHAHDFLIQLEQRLQQVRADEARNTCD